MAKIGLRAYIREIENLIDRGDLQSAQSHCKHILNIFPKCIDAYRLLGKSHIEAKQFSEAEDIFQRVLASIPDDFISHICMSMVREESENLDAAIWHMERAYEMQPSYLDVMNEIKRLYGKRDGVEPPKVKLTRGALVRMYTRTKLFPQAIAECRTALAEEPTRIDLEVLLASLYYQSSQKVEATELCSKILSTHPYCFEANRILSDILPTTTRAEEATTLKNRIIELNPYCAHLSQNITTPDLVPETAVLIEHWEAISQNHPETTNAELKDIPSVGDQTPDWMKPFANQTDETITVASENIELKNEQPNSEPLPDWMKAAGWSESSNVLEELTPAFKEEEIEESDSVLPADIPEWLKDIEPTKIELQNNISDSQKANPFESVSSGESTDSASAPIPEWLTFEESDNNKPSNPTKILTEEISAAENSDQISTNLIIQEDASPSETVPEWLKDLKPQENENFSGLISSHDILEKTEIKENDDESGIVPTDWLEESTTAPSTGRTAPLLPDEELPGWLKEVEITSDGREELKENTESASAIPANDIPDWLKDLSDLDKVEQRQDKEIEKQANDTSISSISTTESDKTNEPVPEDQSSLDTWLSSLNESPIPEQAIESSRDSQDMPVDLPSGHNESIVSKEIFSDSSPKEDILINFDTSIKPISETYKTITKIEDKYFDSYQKVKEYLAKDDYASLGKEISKLLHSNKLVDELLAELQLHTQKYPDKPIIWQLIGDVYFKKNMLQLALESYNKAEYLLH